MARTQLKPQQVQLIANGDLRLSANQNCWPAQKAMEKALSKAVAAAGYELVRVHPYKRNEKHGFIGSQKEGMEVFTRVDPDAPLIVAESVWQYSHHVLHGLMSHRGPILTVANWSGTWPGLVGMLNLNGSLTKAGVRYSTLWSEDFTDDYFTRRLEKWLKTGRCTHATRHVQSLKNIKRPKKAQQTAEKLAAELQDRKAIMGVFDEGCMGMFNAIIPDHLLNPTGVFKERLSQSALYYETTQVSDKEARAVYKWMRQKGMSFHLGKDEATELTEAQVLSQCKMYIAALRIADDFGCHTIGIQYQQGLKDLLPASDLAEGTLNNSDRPDVKDRSGQRILYKGAPLPHFNEVDECAGLDGLLTYRVHKALGQPVENTLHDLRWGDRDASGTVDDYVWVFLISGSAPPAHFIGGWQGADSHRQPPMYFRLGGGAARREQAGRDRLVPLFHRKRASQARPRPRRSARAAGGRDRAALAGDDPAMADHACGDLWRLPRPDDGPAQVEPHPGGLCREQPGRGYSPSHQGRPRRSARGGSPGLRHAQERPRLGLMGR